MTRLVSIIVFSILFVAHINAKRIENGDKPKDGTLNFTISKIVPLKNIIRSGTYFALGSYKGLPYQLQESQEQFAIVFFDKNGNETKKLSFNKGKGPGEVFMTLGSKIVDDTIYLYDQALNKINTYDMNGKFIDDILINDVIQDRIFSFDIFNKKLYFTGMMQNKIAVIDLQTGKITASVKHPYDKPFTDTPPKEMFLSVVSVDPQTGNVYVANLNRPYLIERYSPDLKPDLSFTKKLNYKPDPISLGQNDIEGDMVVSSVFCNGQYVILPSGYTFKENGDGISKNFALNVFNKDTGKYTFDLVNDKLKTFNGTAIIVGENEKQLYLFLMTDESTNEELTGNKSDGLKALVICEKPAKLK